MAIVYAHRKPCDNSVFYIGIGNTIKRAQRCANRNTHWTRVYNKYERTIEIIEDDVSIEQAKELEIFLISEIGISNLCNQTLGGEGAFGLKHTKETIERIASKNRGKKRSKEVRLKVSLANKGHIVTQETRDKISKSRTNNPKVIAAAKGKKHTPESIAKMKEVKKYSRLSKEALEKSTEVRRKNGIQVREITTDKIYYMWNITETLGINKTSILRSIKYNVPVQRGKYKGMIFKKLTNP
jgi:hypothetical protein